MYLYGATFLALTCADKETRKPKAERGTQGTPNSLLKYTQMTHPGVCHANNYNPLIISSHLPGRSTYHLPVFRPPAFCDDSEGGQLPEGPPPPLSVVPRPFTPPPTSRGYSLHHHSPPVIARTPHPIALSIPSP